MLSRFSTSSTSARTLGLTSDPLTLEVAAVPESGDDPLEVGDPDDLDDTEDAFAEEADPAVTLWMALSSFSLFSSSNSSLLVVVAFSASNRVSPADSPFAADNVFFPFGVEVDVGDKCSDVCLVLSPRDPGGRSVHSRSSNLERHCSANGLSRRSDCRNAPDNLISN